MAACNRYGLREPDEESDLFRGPGRYQLSKYAARLSEHTHAAVLGEWHLVNELETQIQELELKLKSELRAHPDAKRLKSLPGVGVVLSATMYLEIGWIERFPTAAQLASLRGLSAGGAC